MDGATGDLLIMGYALNDEEVRPVSVGLAVSDPRLRPLLADPDVATACHSPFDVRFLREAGFEVNGPVIDTKVMAWVLNENTPLDIDWLAWRYAQLDMDKRLRRSGGRVYFEDDDGKRYDLAEWREWAWAGDLPSQVWMRFEAYNRRDVEALRDLERELSERLGEAEWLDYWLEEEVPYTSVLVDMMLRGLPVDLDATADLCAELEVEVVRLREELLAEAGLPPSFNLNSQKQLVAFLFSRSVELNDTIMLGTEAAESLKSCLADEHDECDLFSFTHMEHGLTFETSGWHITDFLPKGFVVDKVGRDRVHGHWVVKGRGLAKTPPPVNKVTGEVGKLPSTSSPELLYAHAADDWVRKLCTEYRKTEKLLTTYLRKFPVIARKDDDGVTRIYGGYNQTGTVTGRLSSQSPNMQNMPARGARGKAVRGLFRFPEEQSLWLVVADYDQLEMRLMAHMSEDPALLKVFRDGEDPHEMLAYAIFGNIDPADIPYGAACSYRDAAKTLNYAMGYGAGKKKVAQTLSLLGWPTSPEVAGGYLAEMESFYAGLFKWKQHLINKAKRRGNVRTLGGRRRRLRAAFKDTANWKMVGYGERQAVNSVVQGTAADIIRRAMVRIDRELPELPLLAQVHDELVLQSRREQGPHVESLMQLQHIGERGHGFDLKVPLLFTPHVGKSWADAKTGESFADLFEEEEDE